MEEKDFKAGCSVMAIFMLLILALCVLVTMQDRALKEQRTTIETLNRDLCESDSIVGVLCKQCDSLQIVVGVDND